MSGKGKVLVTGIGGFVGGHLTRELLDKGYCVEGTVFTETDVENAKKLAADETLEIGEADIHHCDIRDARAVEALIGRTAPDYLIHLAAITFVPASMENPKETFETNLIGTMNLLNAMRSRGPDARVLYVSSSEVYGYVAEEDMPVGETSPIRPANPYSLSKASADILARQYFEFFDLPVVRMRPFNHTGPGQSPRFVCPDFARQVAEIQMGRREPRIEVGNLDARRDFTDVRDVARAYRLALETATAGEAYNVCSGEAVSIGAILDKLVRLSGVDIEVLQDPARMRKADVPVYFGDNGKIADACGWSPVITIDDTLRDLLQYWKRALGGSKGN